jgi:hypothetical protein
MIASPIATKRGIALTALVWALATHPVRAADGVADAALARQARSTPLKAIDYGEDRCDARNIEQWLTALVGAEARRVAWSGGRCEIVGPGIDAGSRWCAQARIALKQPADARDRPMVEIFFEQPRHGRPGAAYAFRGALRTSDGDEPIRFRRDFEAAWISRFPVSVAGVVDCPER